MMSLVKQRCQSRRVFGHRGKNWSYSTGKMAPATLLMHGSCALQKNCVRIIKRACGFFFVSFFPRLCPHLPFR